MTTAKSKPATSAASSATSSTPSPDELAAADAVLEAAGAFDDSSEPTPEPEACFERTEATIAERRPLVDE